MTSKLTVLVSTALLSGFAGGHAAADTWKMQTLWPAGSPNQRIIEDFAADLKAVTAGKVTINVFPVGAVVPFTETLEAVGRGILQAQHTGSVYFTGSEPAMALIGEISGAYENPYQLSNWFYYEGGLALAREAYAKFNVYYVGPVLWGMESNPSKNRIEKIEDFQGVKIRTTQGIASEIMARLGASPVAMPGSEVFSALDKGVIDVADWGTLGMNAQLGLHKVAGYELYPGFFQMPAADIAVNLDVWNALPAETQAQVAMAVRNLNYDMISRLGLQDLDTVAAATGEGVTLVDWTAEERARFRNLAAEVWKDWGDRGDLARRVYESHVAFLTRLGLLQPQ